MESRAKDASNSHHRKFPSNIDSTSVGDLKKEVKKYSLDSCTSRDRSPKKPAIALLDSLSDKNLRKNYAEKRAEEVRHSGGRNPPIERKMAIDGSMDKPSKKLLEPTPELLAALLRGSSEKLVTEQHQKNQRIGASSSLPTAVLNCVVSIYFIFY